MNSYYPIMMRLEGKKVVVVGGGKVAERKVRGLLVTGALVIVVSPDITAALQKLAEEGEIVWLEKAFATQDIKDAFMVFAATDKEEINQAVRASASNHQLVMMADDPDHSDFHVPAHFSRGRLHIAVSTSGASPMLARNIRGQLEQQFDQSYEEYLDFLFSTRQWILKEVKDAALKRKLLTAIVSAEFLNSQNREEEFRRLYEEMMEAGT